MKRLDGTEIRVEDAKRFRKFVNGHMWTFAKTYAAFCPHEYTLRRYADPEEFAWFARFIHDNGFRARYGKSESTYFIDDETGWYYFVSDADFNEDMSLSTVIGLINRANLGQFEFVEESDLFGTRTVVKRLPKERRQAVI